MQRIKLCFYELVTAILICFSCNHRTPEIIHMGFLDYVGKTYNILDTDHLKPYKIMSVYYLVNQSDFERISIKNIEKHISSDTFIQNQIRKDYWRLNVKFYRKSENTDRLIKFRSSKELPLCNGDKIIEYQWSLSKPYDTVYYAPIKSNNYKQLKEIKLLNITDSISHN